MESAEILRLRAATRQLRLHLDTLPIVYDLDVPPEQFLAGKAFMLARQRYACAESMIGAGFAGTVVGALARSLFNEGLRWLWIGEEPARRRRILGDLREERNRLCVSFEKADVDAMGLARWLLPIPRVADLTGQSHSWIDVEPVTSEDELLRDFLAGQLGIVRQARGRVLLDMAGLRGAVMILAHAGHGNYLGLQSSLTGDGVPAFDLRADHEALFLQAAAAGVVSILLGSAAAVPEVWPAEIAMDAFLDEAVALAEKVCDAAVALHGLSRVRKAPAQVGKARRSDATTILRPLAAVIDDASYLPDLNSADAVVAAAEAFYEGVQAVSFDPWQRREIVLQQMLTFSGGRSLLEGVLATYNQPGSEVIAVCSARMLLEEAARLAWRFAVTEDEFKARAKQYFDAFRAMRKSTIDTLAGSGVQRAVAERLLAPPDGVLRDASADDIAKNRVPLPPIASMLRDFGVGFDEPGWLEVAYTLLSQVTHSTPLGYLHLLHAGPVWGTGISPELLALTLDVACTSSAHLIGHGALVLTDVSPEAVAYRKLLLAKAAAVHQVARTVHWLD